LRLPVVGRERSALSVCEEKACVPAKNNILVHVSNVLSSITAFYGGKVISLQRYKKKRREPKNVIALPACLDGEYCLAL